MSEENAVQRIPSGDVTIMQVISQIVASPNAKDQVEVMQKLLEMKERQEDRDAKRMFADALAQLQAEMPAISKNAEIRVKGVLRSKYASIEQLDDVLRPLMEKYGFSLTVSCDELKDTMRRFSGTLRHRGGHSEILTVWMPFDKSDFRSAVQSEGSTMSYAKRQLYKAHFNIIERGIDDDGTGQGFEKISNEEAIDLQSKIAEVKGNTQTFLDYFNIEKLSDMPKANFPIALKMVEQKAKPKEPKA